MKLPDVNVWLALALSGHSHHEAVRSWLETEHTPASIFFCRTTQQGLMRLLTTAAVLAPYGISPLTNREAWEIVDRFIGDERVAFAPEPPEIEAMWRTWTARETASPKLWMDAWLAAFAVSSSFQLVTIDKAFTQFEGLGLQTLKPGSPKKEEIEGTENE